MDAKRKLVAHRVRQLGWRCRRLPSCVRAPYTRGVGHVLPLSPTVYRTAYPTETARQNIAIRTGLIRALRIAAWGVILAFRKSAEGLVAIVAERTSFPKGYVTPGVVCFFAHLTAFYATTLAPRNSGDEPEQFNLLLILSDPACCDV